MFKSPLLKIFNAPFVRKGGRAVIQTTTYITMLLRQQCTHPSRYRPISSLRESFEVQLFCDSYV
uniref:Uncharacterized protein n=1 Tax=Rhizophora mucronata TaxID=61149 RepID=A0A2P2NYJ0_RHIMU